MSTNSSGKKRILITGGRAPVALDLARKLNAYGHEIHMAESMKHHLCKGSMVIKKNHTVPSPRITPEAYIEALIQILKKHQIDILIPSCEEVFYIAQYKKLLSTYAHVLTDEIGKMDKLHNKFLFNQSLVSSKTIYRANTRLMTSNEEYMRLIASKKITFPHVLKPNYSRFSSSVKIVFNQSQCSSDLLFSESYPYMLQEFVDGTLISTFGICNAGEVLTNICYLSPYTAGKRGAGIYFQPITEPNIDDWVKRFVANLHYTGQIAFDIIKKPDGTLWPIECNPRATSGLHLLDEDTIETTIVRSKVCSQSDTLNNKRMLSLPMLIYAHTNIQGNHSFVNFLKAYCFTKSIIFKWWDPIPYFSQFLIFFEFFKIKIKQKISLIQSTTFDIEWNGPE